MFYIKNKVVMFKSSNTVFQFESTIECISNIIISDKKHYINIKLLNNEENIKQLDIYCKQIYSNYENSLYSNCIFTKLPFRYNRFTIQFENLKTSEYFQIGKQFNCCIQFGGFIEKKGKIHACLKIIKVF